MISKPQTRTVKAQRILVTGAAGAVGRAVCRELLNRGHYVYGFDKNPCNDLDQCAIADICDVGALTNAIRGMDAVIHLAATPDEADFYQSLLPNNIEGTHTVFQVANQLKIKRFIYASSMMVSLGYKTDYMVKIEDHPRPANHYALTKLFGESYGQFYAQRGMSVVSARLGWLPRDISHAQLLQNHEFGSRVYLSPGDAGRFFAQSIEHTLEKNFINVFVTSIPLGAAMFDLAPCKRWLDWQPLDKWPEGLPFNLPSA